MEKKLEINLDELRKRHLYIATPAYGGGMHCSYVTSILRLQKLLVEQQLPHTFQFMFNESLISRARNKLTDMFLGQEGATDLLFVDADVEFSPEDVLVMMHMNKEIIGGAYPLKTLDWANVKKALVNNPDLTPDELKYQASKWTTHPKAGAMDVGTFEPLTVDEMATGFMMIKRDVFDTLKPIVPHYTPYSNETSSFGPVSDFFFVGTHADKYESEDYSFCRLWKESGGEIFLCPWIKLNHHGSYAFEGNLIALANGLREIH